MKVGLAHFISSFHNAQNANLEHFTVETSNFLTSVLDLLTLNGYIVGYGHKGPSTQVYLKYPLKKYRIELISKPSKKSYAGLVELTRKYYKNEFLIISSPYGLITLKEAFLIRCGGELLLRVIE